jgi:hypothetical protein
MPMRRLSLRCGRPDAYSTSNVVGPFAQVDSILAACREELTQLEGQIEKVRHAWTSAERVGQ